MSRITLVAACNDRTILEQNLLISPGLDSYIDEVIIQERYSAASEAYNDAITTARGEILILCHQDMYFPESWLPEVLSSLEYLEEQDPAWGVLGCYGVSSRNARYGRVYSSGLGLIGTHIDSPTRVRTLDEIVLILRKSSGLRFSTALPGFHFYGADICLRAHQSGMHNYVIPAFCVHNTQLNPTLPADFYVCYQHFKKLWPEALPLHTSCITVSKFDVPLYTRRLREVYIRHVVRTSAVSTRLANPRTACQVRR